MPRTRHLIGARGATFTNSFAPYPLCCPSRASFLSGQYAHNHGVLGNDEPYGFHAFADRSTIATDLQHAGYFTAFLGKYLNHYGQQPPPDHSSPRSAHYQPPGWSSWRGAPVVADGANKGDPYNYRDTTLNVNGSLRAHEGEYQTRLFSRISRALIRRHADREPLFFWVSYVAPHFGRPIEPDDLGISPAVTDAVRNRFDEVIVGPPRQPEQDVSDKPQFIQTVPELTNDQVRAITEHYRQRVEALTLLDEAVSSTVDALRRAGELSDTYIVFTSDNGYLLGEHRTGGKILPYEPSLRVPLLMRGPGVPAGVVRHDPAMTIDLAPTILRMTGAETARRMDGQSLLSIARRGDRGWTHPVMTETGPFAQLDAWMQRATTDPGPDTKRFGLGLRTRRYLYVRWASQEYELYDLATDPDQLTNVIDDPSYAAVVDSLRHQLATVQDCRDAECR